MPWKCVIRHTQGYGLMGRDTVLFGGQVSIFGEPYRRLLQNEKHLNAVYLCIRRWALYSIPGVEIGF